MNESVPRRILITADAVGGVWNYALELARSFAPEGVQFLLATMGPRPSAEQREEAARVPSVSLVESDYRLEWMDDPWAEVDAASDWVLSLAADFAPDLIHLNGFCHAGLEWPAPVLVVAHSCVVSWWQAVRGSEPPPRYDEYRRRVAAGLAAADRIVAPTAAMLGSLSENYGRNLRGTVIPNGRDPTGFTISEKDPKILAIGRAWDAAKNIFALEDAAAQLTWRAYLAGDVTAPEGASVTLSHLHPLGRVSSAGVAQQLATTAIFCSPARYEPFGLAALEAAFAGCALVLGDIPSLREVWGDAALFVPPENATALAAILQRLASDDPYREEFAGRARARARQFTLERMHARYRALYASLVPRPIRQAA